mgnify:CR=1 FL=1
MVTLVKETTILFTSSPKSSPNSSKDDAPWSTVSWTKNTDSKLYQEYIIKKYEESE